MRYDSGRGVTDVERREPRVDRKEVNCAWETKGGVCGLCGRPFRLQHVVTDGTERCSVQTGCCRWGAARSEDG